MTSGPFMSMQRRRIRRAGRHQVGLGLDSADPLAAYLSDPESRLLRPVPTDTDAEVADPYVWPPDDDTDTDDVDTPDGLDDVDGADETTDPDDNENGGNGGDGGGAGPGAAGVPAVVPGPGPGRLGPGGRMSAATAETPGTDHDAEAGAVEVLRGPGGRTVKLPELVPAAWRDPKALAVFHVKRTWFLARFHGLRLALYGLRLAGWTPRGTGRAARRLWGWATDAESLPLRLGAVERGDVGGYTILSRQRRDRVRTRQYVALTAAVVVPAAVAGGLLAGGLYAAVTALAVVVVFGSVGRPADRRLVDSAELADPRARRITTDVVARAVEAVNLAKADRPIAYQGRWGRAGHGYRGIIVLPEGITNDLAVKHRRRLASALRLPENRVFLTPLPGDVSEAHVELWIPDVNPFAGPPVPSPLIRAERTDLWEPIPFGTDANGNKVELPMVFHSMLIGSVPRRGKTFAARQVAAAAALDPTVRLIVFDAKPGSDWAPFRQVAHRIGIGDTPDVVALLAQTLSEAVDDMDDRYRRLAALPVRLAPESKLTPALSKDPKFNLPLTLICLDEFHDFFADGDHGETIVELVTKLAKKGPAVGVMIMLATQKPDEKSLPSGLRDIVDIRFALQVRTWQHSDMILGTGAAKGQGLNATTLRRPGVGYLVGADDDVYGSMVRTYLLDSEGVDAICQRARALREDGGLLSGQAAGETPELAPTWNLLRQVAETFLPGEEWLWSVDILARLDEAGRGAQMDAVTFGRAMADLGCPTRDIQGPSRQVKKGLRRAAVMETLARHVETSPSASDRPAC